MSSIQHSMKVTAPSSLEISSLVTQVRNWRHEDTDERGRSWLSGILMAVFRVRIVLGPAACS